jgi:TolA-binding protein
MHLRLLALLAALAATPAITPAWAQIESREGIALQNQILELRQEMQNLQQLQSQATGGPAPEQQPGPPMQYQQPGGAPGAAPDNEVTSQLLVRVSELEEQVRSLQGKVDDLTNQLQKQNDDLTKQIGDLSFKLGQGGAPAPGGPPDAGLASPASPPLQEPAAPPPPHRTPELMLKEGDAALARRDYATAEADAQQVLSAGGAHQSDAQMLLARAQMGGHKYKAAAAAYYALYSHAPKSPRAQDALLGVTDALLALNDTNDACQALAKLSAEFPHADAGVHARSVALHRRAGCR